MGAYPPPYMGAASGPVAHGLASMGQRFGGYLIDMVITWAVIGFGFIVLGASVPAATFDNPDPGPNGVAVLVLLLCLAAAFAYYPFFEGKPAGQTLGKKAVGTRVVRQSNGAPLGYGLAFGRNLARIVDYPLFGLGMWWAFGDAQHQAFHDKIAGTLVVRSAVYPPPGTTPTGVAGYQPAPPPSPYQTG